MCWLVLCQFGTSQSHLGIESLTSETNFLRVACKLVWGVFTVGGAMPRQVALGDRRKQAEEALESKSTASVPPCFLLQVLSPGSCVIFLDDELQAVRGNKAFPLPDAFGHGALSWQ